jgi:uncharacterized protein (TIGR00730 family)
MASSEKSTITRTGANPIPELSIVLFLIIHSSSRLSVFAVETLPIFFFLLSAFTGKIMSTSTITTITVFCGSADGVNPIYLEAARAMGRLLAQRSITLIYGAGKTGLMGAVADGALSAGGQVVGVIPSNLNTPRLAHAGLTRLEVSPDIHTRKARMSALAEAFIALPGGFGTFDELFETLTWAQIGLHHKPVGLLNTLGYYDPLLALVEHARAEGFIYNEHRDLLLSDRDPLALLESLERYTPPAGLARWVERPPQV